MSEIPKEHLKEMLYSSFEELRDSLKYDHDHMVSGVGKTICRIQIGGSNFFVKLTLDCGED